MSSVFIYAPDIHEGDAVGNHCLGLVRLLERNGYKTHVFAQRHSTWNGNLSIGNVSDLEAKISKSDILFVSYSIYDQHISKLVKYECKKICYFHNVTPPQLIEKYDPITADLCRRAIEQYSLLSEFDLVIANSTFSMHDLRVRLGNLPKSAVIPPIFSDQKNFRRELHKSKMDNGRVDLLCVGRVVPHKNIEEIICLLAALQSKYRLNAYLTVVGSLPNVEYHKFLINRASALGVLHRISFKGMLSDSDLDFCFGSCDILMSFSGHEGFCVPILEAMFIGMPVVFKSGTAADGVAGDSCIKTTSVDAAGNAIMGLLADTELQMKLSMQEINRATLLIEHASDQRWSQLFDDL
jgi:glycosyltransferase involved in cell wall biosynthesis